MQTPPRKEAPPSTVCVADHLTAGSSCLPLLLLLMVRRVQKPPTETLQYKHRDRRCGLFLQGAPKAPVISHHIKERDYKSKNGASTSGTIKAFVSMFADGPGCFVAECGSSVSH